MAGERGAWAAGPREEEYNVTTNLSGKYAIVGVGQSPIGQVGGVSSTNLLAIAMKNAIEDAGLTNKDIDGLVSRGTDEIYCHHQKMGELLGIDVSYSNSLDSGGASQIMAIMLACQAIETGLCNTVVCGYGRDTWSRTRSPRSKMAVDMVSQAQLGLEFGPEFGMIGAPVDYAFALSRHQAMYGTTKEQLGHIAITLRDHASRNPLAQMQQPITMDDYANARWIVEPLNLLDCSLLSDGAGAVVVTTAERARDLKQPPAYILGFGAQNNLRGWYDGDHMTNTAAIQSAQAAYKMAGLGPKDVDTAQLYDCFTYMLMAELEDYGFCKKGEGGPFVASGALALDGEIPTNTSGGQLSEAHVEGMLQILEGARQIRRQCPAERQVPDAEVALISGHGGRTVCHSTLILGRQPS